MPLPGQLQGKHMRRLTPDQVLQAAHLPTPPCIIHSTHLSWHQPEHKSYLSMHHCQHNAATELDMASMVQHEEVLLK